MKFEHAFDPVLDISRVDHRASLRVPPYLPTYLPSSLASSAEPNNTVIITENSFESTNLRKTIAGVGALGAG